MTGYPGGLGDNPTGGATAGECVISHGTDKQGLRRSQRASWGRLCKNHGKRLAEWLKDIAVDYVLLETLVMPSQGKQERRGKGDASAAPINLNVVALRDSERAAQHGLRERGDELWYELPDIPSALAIIHARAEDIRGMLDDDHDPDASVKDVTLIAEVKYLLLTFDTLTGADWVDEAFEEIKRVWIAMQRAHDRPRPSPLGHCLSVSCDGTVWPRPQADPWCSKCKRIYDTAADWARIAVQEDKLKAARKAKSA